MATRPPLVSRTRGVRREARLRHWGQRTPVEVGVWRWGVLPSTQGSDRPGREVLSSVWQERGRQTCSVRADLFGESRPVAPVLTSSATASGPLEKSREPPATPGSISASVRLSLPSSHQIERHKKRRESDLCDPPPSFRRPVSACGETKGPRFLLVQTFRARTARAQ